MSHFGPYTSAVGLVERSSHLIDLQLLNRPQVVAYRLWGHQNLNDAYGNPLGTGGANSMVAGTGAVQMLEVQAGQAFRSAGVIQRKLGLYEEGLQGTTRIFFDPDDFANDPQTDLPGDDGTLYVRVQEQPLTKAGFNVVSAAFINAAKPVLGPIYVVPPAKFFGMVGPPISLDGTAPANTGSVKGKVPNLTPDGQAPNPMHIVFPRHCRNFHLINRHATKILLLSFGLGDSMSSLGPGEDIMLYGNVKEVILAALENTGAGAVGIEFSIQAIVALGDGLI